MAPLSVMQSNIDAGYFINNQGTWDSSTYSYTSTYPIEYDGLSNPLSFFAPLNTSLTTHTIKIAIADTNDAALDSGMFIANLKTDSSGATSGVKQTIETTDGNDTIDGGDTADYALLGFGDDFMNGGGGNDYVKGNQGNDTIMGGLGDDNLYGSLNDDTLVGNKGNDTLGGGEGDDRVAGGGDSDYVGGGKGNDTLIGGMGDDTLVGGMGNDLMIGGAGADTFIFSSQSGADEILDFTPGVDKIDIYSNVNGNGIYATADILAHTYDNTVLDAVIDLGGGNTITLIGIQTSDLSASDFMLI